MVRAGIRAVRPAAKIAGFRGRPLAISQGGWAYGHGRGRPPRVSALASLITSRRRLGARRQKSQVARMALVVVVRITMQIAMDVLIVISAGTTSVAARAMVCPPARFRACKRPAVASGPCGGAYGRALKCADVVLGSRQGMASPREVAWLPPLRG